MKQLKQKALILTNMIAPYRVPLFNTIFDRENIDLKVIALVEKEKNRKWNFLKEKIKFNYEILTGLHLFFWGAKRETPVHLNKNVISTIKKYNPDVVIVSGYDSFAYWQAFLYCKIYKKKFILWNGTTMFSTGSIKGLRGVLKQIIIRGADKYIAYGTKAKEYLEYFGANPIDIFVTTNTVDMNHFKDNVNLYRNNVSLREKRKKYPEILLLYVGQLITRKGILQVLKALKNLNCKRTGFVVIGSGPEENTLKQFCQENNLKNVYFEGFKQIEELPEYYALADVFILPSLEEVWGLVVNESLASGLYVLSSKYAGASYDLVRSGWNGEVFDANNVQEIVELIKKTIKKLPEIKNRRDEISKRACEEFSIYKSADVFIRCIQNFSKNEK